MSDECNIFCQGPCLRCIARRSIFCFDVPSYLEHPGMIIRYKKHMFVTMRFNQRLELCFVFSCFQFWDDDFHLNIFWSPLFVEPPATRKLSPPVQTCVSCGTPMDRYGWVAIRCWAVASLPTSSACRRWTPWHSPTERWRLFASMDQCWPGAIAATAERRRQCSTVKMWGRSTALPRRSLWFAEMDQWWRGDRISMEEIAGLCRKSWRMWLTFVERALKDLSLRREVEGVEIHSDLQHISSWKYTPFWIVWIFLPETCNPQDQKWSLFYCMLEDLKKKCGGCGSIGFRFCPTHSAL